MLLSELPPNEIKAGVRVRGHGGRLGVIKSHGFLSLMQALPVLSSPVLVIEWNGGGETCILFDPNNLEDIKHLEELQIEIML